MGLVHFGAAGALCIVIGTTSALASSGRGMTWGKMNHGNSPGVDEVGCHAGGVSCNAYNGDTSCMVSLPILCIKMDGSPKPSGLSTDFYNGWVGGNIATTQPIPGTWLTSQAAADQLCANYFGTGWQMAQFHHSSGGWAWYSYGNVRSDTRFWVRISDQPANCWNP